MALDNYDNLVKSVIDWSHREDLSTLIADFIQLSENEMYSNDDATLKVRSMEIISESIADSKYLSLPDNYESSRSIRLVIDGNVELVYRTPEAMKRYAYVGLPRFYTIVGNEIEFDRTPDSEYTVELQYYRRAANLTETNQTNEILLQHPNIYLNGALYQLFTHSQDYQQQQVYYGRFINAIKGANKADKRGRFGTAPQVSIDIGMVV